MTLIYSKAVGAKQPAVHVFVIGVGNYPYLEKGSKKTFRPNGGLGQLGSPVASAQVFCQWLQQEFRPRKLELGSIEVLCSEGGTFEDATGKFRTVAAPTMANVRKAADMWMARGSAHEDNLLIFYFCGHGVSTGVVHSLLLEDFGKHKNDPFTTGAIDANAFMDGIRGAAANSQLFLLDACRKVSHTEFNNYGNVRGAPIISAVANTRLGVVEQAALWATSLGQLAYGVPNQPSVFMSAMLHAMQGGGALQDSDDGKWVIQPDVLKRAIDHIVQRQPEFAHSELQFASLERMSKGIAVHMLDGEPSVPVKVNCIPTSRNIHTEFQCSSGAKRKSGTPTPWHLDLTCNRYTFRAIEGKAKKIKSALALPPYAVVTFDCTK